MKLKKNMHTMVFKIVLLFFAVTAFATTDSLVQKQEVMIQKLDSIDNSVMGLRLGGTATAGFISSKLTSDPLSPNSPTRDNQAYTHLKLRLDARPSKETNARVELTLHKDWHQAQEEGINPVIGRWFSYDGKILNKKVDFNLGYMRVSHTPLTLFTPQTEILQEPTIFKEHRVDALADRNLDTTNNRLLQGLNVHYNSGKLGVLDNIYAQATGARLRATAKKYDQVFFDFDWSDRYFAGGRTGLEAYGAHLGLNYVNTFDRIRSTRAVAGPNPLAAYFYDFNKVFTVDAGFDSKNLVSLPISFGVDGEFAMSNWRYRADSLTQKTKTHYSLIEGISRINSYEGESSFYVQKTESTSKDWKLKTLLKEDGNAFYVTPFVKADLFGFNLDLKATYLQNDSNFWAEMASTPLYQRNISILNADAFYDNQLLDGVIASFRSGNLENLYFSIYNSNVLNRQNLMTINASTTLESDGTSDSRFVLSRLYNNYKLGHFYKNAYNANTWKRLEFLVDDLDPSVNMALPLGLATPDRQGVLVSLDADYKKWFELNARFSKIERQSIDIDYTTIAVGLKANVDEIFALHNDLNIAFSAEEAKESKSELKTTRLNAGVDIGFLSKWSVLAGLQILNKDFGKDPVSFGGLYPSPDDPNAEVFVTTATVQKTQELFALGGLKYKIAPNSSLSLQGGVLNNSITYLDMIGKKNDLDIDKFIIMAGLKVNF